MSTTPARICRGKTLFSNLEFNMVSSSIRCLAPDKVVGQGLPLLFLPFPFPFNENMKPPFLLLYIFYSCTVQSDSYSVLKIGDFGGSGSGSESEPESPWL